MEKENIFELEKKLKTNLNSGISGTDSDISERWQLYGKNEVYSYFVIYRFLIYYLLIF